MGKDLEEDAEAVSAAMARDWSWFSAELIGLIGRGQRGIFYTGNSRDQVRKFLKSGEGADYEWHNKSDG